MNAIEYHLQTRHFPNRFAKSLGYLDWENQPSPYKSYYKAPKVPLKITSELNLPYEKLYLKNSSQKFNLENISKFFELSLALSAVKEYYTSRWAVRINPSSGNLHPEESYIIYKNSVYHFNVKEFALEEIAKSEDILVEDGFIFILTSIPLRESWKYGERALRYCLLDSGHAIASSRFASNLLGWKMEIIDEFSDTELEKTIGLDKQQFYKNEEEIFEAAFYIYSNKKPKLDIKKFENLEFTLEYSPLAKDSIRWEIIYKTDLKRDKKLNPQFVKFPLNFKPSPFNAETIIKNRRSSLGYEPRYIKKEDFLDILDKTLPRNIPPFDTRAFLGKINFVVFINRVDGIESGIYFFDRAKNEFSVIEKGDFSDAAKFVNCVQDLGKESAFSISMVIDKNEIKQNSDYKLAMFEAGIIGQILYLEAEAKNIRGCGIGCFFDDLVSVEILKNPDILTLYGFTIGFPLVDERIIPIKANEGKFL
ncbi:SagB/ThcOx family dehydrogenase [Caminibacter sp.]